MRSNGQVVGSNPVSRTKKERIQFGFSPFWWPACGWRISASLKRERGLPSPLALFPCRPESRFGFELPRCTTSEFTPHGSKVAIAIAIAIFSSVLRGSFFPNRTRITGLRFGARFRFGFPLLSSRFRQGLAVNSAQRQKYEQKMAAEAGPFRAQPLRYDLKFYPLYRSRQAKHSSIILSMISFTGSTSWRMPVT